MYALIGHPLGHSMSPFIHKKLFEISGIKEDYELCDIPSESLEKDFSKVISEYNGLNVTIPYKQSVISFMDKLAKSAEKYNAVNCISKENGKLIGHNTDCIGFLRSVSAEALGGRFLLSGCGGVGRMMALEAAEKGADITIGIIEISAKQAEVLTEEINVKFPKVKVKTVPLNKIEGKFDLFANATPVGMYPNNDACPVSEEVIANCENIFDAIYNPNETVLVKTAKKLGKHAVGGMTMLVLQAAAAHEIWYGGKFTKQQTEKIVSEASEAMENMFK